MGVFGHILSGILGDDGGKLGNIGGGLGIAAEFTGGKTSDGLTIGSGGAGLLGSIQGFAQSVQMKKRIGGKIKRDGVGIVGSILGGLGAGLDIATGIAGIKKHEKAAGILRVLSGTAGTFGGILKGGKAIWDLLHLRKDQAREGRTQDDIDKDKAEAWQNLFGGAMQTFRGITSAHQGYFRAKEDSTSQNAKNWAIAGKAASIATVLPGLLGSFGDGKVYDQRVHNVRENED